MSLGASQLRLLCAALLAVIGAGACARAARESDGVDGIQRAESTFTVRVVNHSQIDAVIFLVHDGVHDRLGAVTAATTSSFSVRTRALSGAGEFAILADPVGSRRTTSSEILHVAQGTVFTWTLETDFSRGAVMVQD